MLSIFSDKTNRTISFQDGVDLLLEYCKQPVFHPYYHGIKEGLIGGRVISHYEQGRQAAIIAKEVMRGIDIDSIETINESPNQYVFNYKTMQMYDIGTKWLPERSILMHKHESIFHKYGIVIGAVILILSILLMIILTLMQNIYKKKAAEAKLKEKTNTTHCSQ